MPKVSIIVPVYNSAPFLPGCLDSVLAQHFTDFEVICIDDGSTDGSVEILDRYENLDERVIVIKLESNQGPGPARNFAIQQARGIFLAFIDSDDWMDERLLDKAVSRAESTNADLVIWDTWIWDNRLSQKRRADSIYPERFGSDVFSWKGNPDFIFQSFQNWPWNKLFRTDFINKHSIRFQDIKRTEDLMFTCPALVQAERIACIAEPLSFYRIGREDSAMCTKDPFALDFYSAFLMLKTYLQNERLYDELKRSFDNWALSGSLYNLETLKSSGSFRVAFEFLRDEGFEKLGIEDISDGYYYDERWLADYRAIKNDDAELFLLTRLERVSSLLDDAMTLSSTYESSWKNDKRYLSDQLSLCRAERERLHDSLNQEISRRDERAQRIGKAVLHLPRKIKRALKNE